MNTSYASLIDKERAKISAFRAAIAKCEKRIITLQSMGDDDDLYQLLLRKNGEQRQEGEVSTNQEAVATSHRKSASIAGFPKRALDEKTLKMLRFADETDKPTSAFSEYAKDNGIPWEPPRMRSFLNMYKLKYRLLESSQDGYFRLSDVGAAYLKSLANSVIHEEAPISAP
jgi:hypothetical protein